MRRNLGGKGNKFLIVNIHIIKMRKARKEVYYELGLH